jgi:MFS family permease
MYVGLIVSYIFISLFGDYFGRKTFIIVGAISSIIGTLFAIFINNIYLASIGLLVGIFGVQIIFGLSFTIIS